MSGCSKQEYGFSERCPYFREKGVEVLGVIICAQDKVKAADNSEEMLKAVEG